MITKHIQNYNLLGETKLVPPRKDRNANYLIIRSIYLRIMRGDLLERMGKQLPDIDDYIFVNSVSTGNLVEMIFCPIEQGLYVRHRAYSERRQ